MLNTNINKQVQLIGFVGHKKPIYNEHNLTHYKQFGVYYLKLNFKY